MATVTFEGNPLHLEGTLPEVGKKAPDFSLTTNDLANRTLAEYAGKALILVCVPSLDTPVCDMEVRRFNTEAAKLSGDVVIAAVSRDLPFAQARWCGAHNAKAVVTLSDYRTGSFGKAYGIYIKELDLLARSIFIIDKSGVLRYCELVSEVTHEPDYDKALAELAKYA
ncbi:MAG: thiol peroxidase [Desulfovibrionaceae bacterium]|nr:thiol peroxidase [Desulfovibrionaceae bacterium]